MVDFKKLKAMSGKNSVAALAEKIKKSEEDQGFTTDERYWQPTVDKAGNGFAIVRFLPAAGEDDLPFTKFWEHWFKSKETGLWYVEKSRTSLGKNEPDPCAEFNTKLWNSSDDDKGPERSQARDQKRRLYYVSNIYVVSDPAKPENNGKVFLYKYGMKIFQKCQDAMSPPFDEMGRGPDNPEYDPSNAFDPYDLWEGANFKIMIRKVDGQRNYDNSIFDKCSPLLKNDKDLETVYNSEYSLKEVNALSTFKSYDELKERLTLVLYGDKTKVAPRKSTDEEIPFTDHKPARSSAASKIPAAVEEGGDDDESIEFFRKMANR